jgi:hypothetical protein
MSRVYFHTETDGDFELSGRERARMAQSLQRLAWSVLIDSDDRYETEQRIKDWRKVLSPNHYLKNAGLRESHFFEDLETWFVVGDIGGRHWLEYERGGEPIRLSPFVMQLNTGVATKSPFYSFYARVHGQSELHCYIEGEHRAWLADVLRQGLDEFVLPHNTDYGKYRGYHDLIPFLEKRDTEPVVLSYSVCQQFPGSFLTESQNERLSKTRRWAKAVDALREKNATAKLQIAPENLTLQGFDNGVSAFEYRQWFERVFLTNGG